MIRNTQEYKKLAGEVHAPDELGSEILFRDGEIDTVTVIVGRYPQGIKCGFDAIYEVYYSILRDKLAGIKKANPASIYSGQK